MLVALDAAPHVDDQRDAFARLVDDPSPEVRSVVALQSRIGGEAIEKLRNDPDERVRDAANRWAR